MQNEMPLDLRDTSAQGTKPSSADTGGIDPQLVIIKSVLEKEASQSAASNAPRAKPTSKSKASSPNALVKFARTALSVVLRPDLPRILSVGLLGFLLVFHTGTVLFIAAISVLIALVLYFSLGPDRIRNWALARYNRMRTRNPEAAERLRRRAAKTSAAIGVVVDRLPESWTQGLYLPDFDEPDELAEKWTSDPFDRLNRE